MRKILVPTLVLLGATSTLATNSKIKRHNLAQLGQDTNANAGETPDELTTWKYHFEEITEFEMQEITEYWQNRTNGEHCIDIFTQITENFHLLQEVVYDIEGLIQTYNKDCNDKCLPGYVKCQNGPEGQCIKECDCCALQTNDAGDNLVCCASNNHPVGTINYSLSEGKDLFCYDFCCEDTEVFCKDICVPQGTSLGVGVSYPQSHTTDDYGYGYEGEGTENPVTFPIVCCTGNDCCDAGDMWPVHIFPDSEFCCTHGELIPTDISGLDEDKCCCNVDEICCTNLAPGNTCTTVAENPLCCDLATEQSCHGECQSLDIPCCEEGLFNCQYQDNACVSYCCCDEDHECCEDRETCIPTGTKCCPLEQKECNDGCIPELDTCCPPDQSVCEFTYKCELHCCDTLNGFTWCEYTKKCEKHCCPQDQVWCDGSLSCIAVGEPCCGVGLEWCESTQECSDHCCEYNQNVHEIWCVIEEENVAECREECKCCPADKGACKCTKGEIGTDHKCYLLDSEDCCEEYWCDKCSTCVADEAACCICDEVHTYIELDEIAPYDSARCCGIDSTHFSVGTFGVGCCFYLQEDDAVITSCCKDNEKQTFNPNTNQCEENPPNLPPCPCEGCCDFNCCDELDFFMHKAYYDHYDDVYDTFTAFYEDFYKEFYAWWHSPVQSA